MCLSDVLHFSTLQDGFELPSRLGVSASDCFLTISGALTKVAELQGKKAKLNTKAKDQTITIIPSHTIDKKVKLGSKTLLTSKIERDYTLWPHLDGLICLVQKLLSVSLYTYNSCLTHLYFR